MLTSLSISDVVLIEKLNVPFARGLNVLSGETGAGKSILLDALALALGARSDAGLIRRGAKQASVTATFSCRPPTALASLLEEQGLAAEEEMILRRTIGADGKSRAFLNDQPIGVALLRQIGETLLEVHGQFETRGLLDSATHRGLLDSFAGLDGLKKKTAGAHVAWREARKARAEALAERERARAEEEFLRAAVAELDELAPQAGELDLLAEKRGRLQNMEKIFEALRSAETALSGERGAASSLAQAGKSLARVADKEKSVAALLESVDRAASEVEEACAALARTAQELEADPDALEKIEERFFKLRAVARKHGVPAERLEKTHADLRARLALLEGKGDALAGLAEKEAKARASYVKLAEELSARRKAGAESLAGGVNEELPPLKFERAAFSVRIETLPEEQWGPEGMDKIAFLAATNPGAEPAPLHKVASGGELARFMLALKVVLAKADPVPTLVFDEVDAGIGGRVASAVGERLARLGRDVQVLVVTHSPQVAARADRHLRVEKTVKGKGAATNVTALNETERVEEIARMLAGEETTDAAREAARSLIEEEGKKERKRKRA